MKKLTILTLLIGSSTFSLFASGTTGCDSVTSSGCGAWWQNYTLGTSTDGIFAQSSGVGLSYTANFTSVAASQDPLTAAFPWVSTSSSTLSTSNSSSYGSLITSVSTVVTSTSNTTSAASTGGFGDLMTTLSSATTTGSTTNIASTVPTNTGGSTTMALFTDSASSYSSYLAQIYGLAYGNQNTSMNINPNAVGNADPIVPEPSSYVSMGLGLAAVVAYARRKKSK